MSVRLSAPPRRENGASPLWYSCLRRSLEVEIGGKAAVALEAGSPLGARTARYRIADVEAYLLLLRRTSR
jgi:hypothetical protein